MGLLRNKMRMANKLSRRRDARKERRLYKRLGTKAFVIEEVRVGSAGVVETYDNLVNKMKIIVNERWPGRDYHWQLHIADDINFTGPDLIMEITGEAVFQIYLALD